MLLTTSVVHWKHNFTQFKRELHIYISYWDFYTKSKCFVWSLDLNFQMDLMPFINKAGCECLNESDEHGFDNCLRKDMTFLESDCDEQVTECLGLVEIISICAHTCLHLMVSCLSFPDDHFFLPFYNFTSVLWPCQLTPFLCLCQLHCGES